MEIGLIVLAIMLVTLLGWLLKQSFNTQPWVAEEVSAASPSCSFVRYCSTQHYMGCNSSAFEEQVGY